LIYWLSAFAERVSKNESKLAQRLVKDWALQYQQELLRMWQSNEYKHLPGLE